MKSAVIYFGGSESSDDNDGNDVFRRGRGLVGEFPGVRIVQELPAICALIVEATEAGLVHVRNALAETGLGRLTVSEPAKPLFRAAR